MITCTECGYDNTDALDVCEACGSFLKRQENVDDGTPFDSHLLGDVIDVLAPRPAALITSSARVTEAVAVMRADRRGCLLVKDDERVVGIFTEHDLVAKVAALGLSPGKVTVAEVMTPDPVVLRHDDTMAVAINKMVLGGFRHVPLVDADGKIDGIVSAREVLARLYELLQLPASASR
jgi:CBS domain-containing protein